ncbi:MAG: hypothetical protein NZ455_01735 [Bacteroidia bacterium]|nr:hypothetical protein [Bacteroidia bacterium]MDW8347109.1 hypothetical protein [Bacteroidia bacterium]
MGYLREACGGCVSSAQHRSEAQPLARRPCLHEHMRNAGKDTPKNEIIYLA